MTTTTTNHNQIVEFLWFKKKKFQFFIIGIAIVEIPC